MRMRSVALVCTFTGIIAVWILCLARLPESQHAFHYMDKVEHMSAYVLQSVCLLVLFPQARWKAVLWLLFQGAAIEGLQSLTSYRSAEWADVVANSIGVFLGLGLSFTPPALWVSRRL